MSANENERRLVSAILEEVIAKSKAAAAVRTPGQRAALFAIPEHPPGVAPASGGMAQDKAITERLDWAKSKLALDTQLGAPLGFNGNLAYANGVGFMGFAMLAELAQIPEYRVITETIADETTREWIELKSSGDVEDPGPLVTKVQKALGKDSEKTEKVKRLEEALTRYRVREHFRSVAVGDGFFGRGHLFLDFGEDEGDELLKSIGNGRDAMSRSKVNREHPLRGLRAVEATWCYPIEYNTTNPLKADWYAPQKWYALSTQLHVTRLLTFIGRRVPDLLKPVYSFGGLSLSQMAKPYIDNWLRTRQAVADLIWSFTDNVLKTDLSTLLQDADSANSLMARVMAFNQLRTNQGTMVINRETEDWAKVITPLSGLHELQAQAQEHMAAVSRIPLVKLLGITPSGLNPSASDEIRTFYDSIRAYQELLFREHLTTVIDFIQLSVFGDIDPEITFDFKPLWQLDSAGQAAVEKTRADVHAVYLDAQVVTPTEVREALAADPDSPYASLDLDAELPVPEEGGVPEGEEDLEEDQPQQQIRDPSDRFAASVTNKAANLGGAGSGA